MANKMSTQFAVPSLIVTEMLVTFVEKCRQTQRDPTQRSKESECMKLAKKAIKKMKIQIQIPDNDKNPCLP